MVDNQMRIQLVLNGPITFDKTYIEVFIGKRLIKIFK